MGIGVSLFTSSARGRRPRYVLSALCNEIPSPSPSPPPRPAAGLPAGRSIAFLPKGIGLDCVVAAVKRVLSLVGSAGLAYDLPVGDSMGEKLVASLSG